MVYGKVPPNAKEIEQAVLGAIMLERSAIDMAAFILRPESFYTDANQGVYRAMLRLSQKSMPIDIFTVVEELKAGGEIDRVGGAYYVTSLTNSVVSAANLETHARIIQQKFIGRELIRFCGQVIGDAYDGQMDVFELLDRAETDIMSIGNMNINQEMVDMSKALVMTMSQVEEWRTTPSGLTGIPTGFPSLDWATRGWQPTDLIILAARPSVGKSAFALRLVRAAAGAGFPVGFFSLEMKIVQLLLRVLSAETGVYLERIQTGRLDDGHMDTLYKKGINQLAKLKVFFDDSPGLTMLVFRAKCRRLVEKKGVKLIIVDYLQLMNLDEKAGNREQEIARISRELKKLARELNVPIIALSQLSRALESRVGAKRKPQLSDLRESGAIEQDADLVMFLWAPEEEEAEQDASLLTRRYLKIAKQRAGRLTTIDLDFQNEVQYFEEVAKSDRPSPTTSGFPAGNWKPVPDTKLPYPDKD